MVNSFFPAASLAAGLLPGASLAGAALSTKTSGSFRSMFAVATSTGTPFPCGAPLKYACSVYLPGARLLNANEPSR